MFNGSLAGLQLLEAIKWIQRAGLLFGVFLADVPVTHWLVHGVSRTISMESRAPARVCGRKQSKVMYCTASVHMLVTLAFAGTRICYASIG